MTRNLFRVFSFRVRPDDGAMIPLPKLRLSLDGAACLIEAEDWRRKVYPDSDRNLTIGVGHLLTRSELASGKITIRDRTIRWSDGLSDVDVMLLLVQDASPREAAINRLVEVPLAQNQFDALLMFVFNVGEEAFANSTLLRQLNRGMYASVPEQLRRWVHSGGKVSRGLKNRREKEIVLWADLP
jgi:lysozyme